MTLARRSLLLSLASLLTAILGAGSALARPTGDELADQAIAAINEIVQTVETDTADLEALAIAAFEELALHPDADKRERLIEKAGRKFMKFTDKARAKVAKMIDKIAVKAARRIAKVDGDPDLIAQVESIRTAAQANCTQLLDDMWDAIAQAQEDALGAS